MEEKFISPCEDRKRELADCKLAFYTLFVLFIISFVVNSAFIYDKVKNEKPPKEKTNREKLKAFECYPDSTNQ